MINARCNNKPENTKKNSISSQTHTAQHAHIRTCTVAAGEAAAALPEYLEIAAGWQYCTNEMARQHFYLNFNHFVLVIHMAEKM